MHLNQSNPAALRPLQDFNFQVWQSLGLTLPLDLGPSCDFNLNCLPSAFGTPWHGYCSPAANSGWESCCDTLGDNLTCPAASKDCFFGLFFFFTWFLTRFLTWFLAVFASPLNGSERFGTENERFRGIPPQKGMKNVRKNSRKNSCKNQSKGS